MAKNSEVEVSVCKEDDALLKAKNLAKIVFEPEDCPPLSWYERNQMRPPKKDVIKIGDKEIQRSEWVKAPEFVPRVLPQPKKSVPAPKTETNNNERGSLPNIFVNPQSPFTDCRFPVIQQQPLSTIPPVHRVPPRPNLLPHPLIPLPPGVPNLQQLRAMMRFPMLRPPIVPTAPGRPLRPFGLNMFAPRPILYSSGVRDNGSNGLPPGYTANLTSINAGGGPPIPAIVLKKKRKKRRKNKTRSAIFADELANCSDTTGSPKPLGGSLILDDLDDMTSSSSGSALVTNQRRSEPDLTKLSIERRSPLGPISVPKKLVGDMAPRQYPNDPDLIQSALENSHITMTNSCPDLSEAQKKLLEEFWDLQEDSLSRFNKEPTKTSKIQQQDNNLEIFDDFQVSSPPVSSAIQTALESEEGKITSQAVKELDRQVRSEMSINWTLDVSSSVFDDEEEEEEQIFDRLLRTQAMEKRFPNCGGPGKSLFEEIEEKQLLFPDRVPVHVAVVHGKNGANSMLLNGGENHDRFTRQTVDSLFNPLENSDDDDHDDMHITVNTFEDPEELILDDENDHPRYTGKFSQIRESLKGLKRSKSLEFPLYQPKSEACCSLM